MKKINLLVVAVISMLLSTCTKEYITNITKIDTLTVNMDTLTVHLDTLNVHIDSITIKLKNAGSLKVQLADNSGKTYPNIKIHLCSDYYTSGSQLVLLGEIDTRNTDANGKINFRRVASGTYYVVSDTIIIGTRKYIIARGVQVLSNDSTEIVINPLDYAGTINLHVNISGNSYDVDTLKKTSLRVALVNYKDYNANDTRKKVISKAIDIQSCNANADVVFKNIPSNIGYAAYVYINNDDSIGDWDYTYSVSKDNVTTGTVYVEMSSLYVPRSDVSLTLKYYSYTIYDYKPVEAANVVLVTYNDYSNYSLYSASQSTILSHAIATGKTNSSGLVTFTKIPSGIEYEVYVYYNNTNDTWASYVYVSSSSSNIFTNYVTGSDLGLTKK